MIGVGGGLSVSAADVVPAVGPAVEVFLVGR